MEASSLIKIGQVVFSVISKIAKTNKRTLLVNQKNIEEAIRQHTNKINAFSSTISFKELSKPKALSSVYVHLDLDLMPIEKKQKGSENIPNNATEIIERVFKETANNIIIRGVPGAGKSTTLKYVCNEMFTSEDFLGENLKFPILIRFRDDEIGQNMEIPLFEYILNIFGLIIETKKTDNNAEGQVELMALNNFKKKAAITILNELSPLIILDGLDEVTNEKLRDKLIKEINDLSLYLSQGRFILTTRKGDDDFHIENTQSFDLAPLTDKKINIFTEKWLGKEGSVEFMKQIKKSSVFDSAKRPLTLSHLCAIFEKEGKIPVKSRFIYRKIVNLLILEWNLENQIKRKSKFGDFDADRKKEFLENLAFELSFNMNKFQFTTNDLEICYRNLNLKYDLPILQMTEVIKEIQVHNGLIVQTSYNKYEFAHKSFQEYLAAEYLVKLPKLPEMIFLFKIPSEIALAVTLSSEPSFYLSTFIEETLSLEFLDINFFNKFFTRISIEKPDFIEMSELAKALIDLQNRLISQIDPIVNSIQTQKFKDDFSLIDHIFQLLLGFEAIRLSIKEYLKNNITISRKNEEFSVLSKYHTNGHDDGFTGQPKGNNSIALIYISNKLLEL